MSNSDEEGTDFNNDLEDGLEDDGDNLNYKDDGADDAHEGLPKKLKSSKDVKTDRQMSNVNSLLLSVVSGVLSDLPPEQKNAIRIFLSSTFTGEFNFFCL